MSKHKATLKFVWLKYWIDLLDRIEQFRLEFFDIEVLGTCYYEKLLGIYGDWQDFTFK